MKNILFLFIIFIASFQVKAQETGGKGDLTVPVINGTFELKDATYNIRANKGDVLRFNLQTEVKNANRGTYHDLSNVRIVRQFATDPSLYIFDRNEVSVIKDLDILVPSDGIYTLTIDRGGVTKFNTTLNISRIAMNDSLKIVQRKAFWVEIPDTLHSYQRDSVVYDYVRVAVPKIKQEKIAPYYEDQILVDRAYALEPGGKAWVPIVMPEQITSDYRNSKAIKWGYIISVGDEVYKALQGQVSAIAAAGIDAGVGKIMSAKVNPNTGEAVSTGLTKGYDVFDNVSQANAIAEIGQKTGEATGNQTVSNTSNTMATISGFTGFSDVAGDRIASFVPRIEDKVHWKIIPKSDIQSYLDGGSFTTLAKGTSGYASGEYNADYQKVYYLTIENERSLDGNALDVLETLGKTILSQYVYVSVKVFVQVETTITYDKGYYEQVEIPVYNSVWNHSEEIKTSIHVIFEDQIKPYYKVLGQQDIY